MTTQFVERYLNNKINENENYIVCTFYDLRVKNNLSEEDVQKFLEWSKNKLENMGYKVYFTGEEYVYKSENMKVEDNQYMIAIQRRDEYEL